LFSIGAVSRQTGIDQSRLRKWESRYGFPTPTRLTSTARAYQEEDIRLIHEIARRIALGEKPGHVIPELIKRRAQGELSNEPALPIGSQLTPAVKEAFMSVIRNDFKNLKQLLVANRRRITLHQFIEEFATPLSTAIGESWEEGLLPIYSEHLYTSVLESFLIREVDSFVNSSPRILLVTLAGEKHQLGLQMIQAALYEQGITSFRTSSDLPVNEIVALSREIDCVAVGVSVSMDNSPHLLSSELKTLRANLDDHISVWVGGRGIKTLPRLPDGIDTFVMLSELTEKAKKLLGESN
jgi:DNA-binding transcriptional MerR regulator/methylmalonyl-CoA mutase cobalamin-binding subunit